MPQKLETILNKIPNIKNLINRQLILDFHKFLVSRDTSINYQKDNINVLVRYAEFLPDNLDFYQINIKDPIISFLDSKRKDKEEDPDQKWITTWNDYLWRLKYFFRWLHNSRSNPNPEEWETPKFADIKKKKTKRLSPYSEGDMWDREELLVIVKYESHKRNKAILTLLWDLNARPHEITLLKLKDIRLREKYGEGEIPYQAKTGSGPILLTLSFPYIRDWLNIHPFRNEPHARLIGNFITGAPIKPTAIYDMMSRLRKRIIRLLATCEIKDQQEIKKLEYLLKSKKWNPYCIRHSSITADSDYLPEYALKKKVRWSMNSKQGIRYIKRKMGNDLKEKILQQNGIVLDSVMNKPNVRIDCPRCAFINIVESKFCTSCSYPLKPEAYDEIKELEKRQINSLEKKLEQTNQRVIQIISMIQQNPLLSSIKPEVLMQKEIE